MAGLLLALSVVEGLALQGDPEKLLDSLRSEDVEARAAAHRRLKELGAEAVPALTKASTSPDAETAARAKVLLRLIAIRGTLNPRLCKAFPDAEERIDKGGAAALFLEAGGLDARGRPARAELTPEDLALLLPHALRAKPGAPADVWQTVDARRVPAAAALREFLNRDDGVDPMGDLHAVIAFLHDAGPEDLPRLVRRAWPWGYRTGDTTQASFRAREATLEVAFRLRGPGLAARIRPLLKERGDGPRQGAVEILAQLGARECAAEIAALGQERSISLKETVFEALPRLGAREQADVLRAAGKDPFPNTRLWAVIALHRLGFDEARAPLLASALSGQGYAQDFATRALLDVGPVPVEDLLKIPEGPSRGRALYLLGLAGHAPALPALLEGLKSTSPETRRGAIQGLGRLRLKEAVEPLLAAEPSSDTLQALARLGAAAALPALRKADPTAEVLDVRSRLGDPGVFEPAKVLLRSPAMSDRMAGARILERLRTPEAVEALRGALGDADRYVRRQVVDSLGDAGAVAAVPDLLALLDKDVEYVKPTLAESLCRLGSAEGRPWMLENARRQGRFAWLWPLNALRKPAAWARLDRPSTTDWSGTGREFAERLAAEAGLKAEFPELLRPEAAEWLSGRVRRHLLVFADPPAAPTIRQALEAFLAWGQVDAVLEDDRIRFLDRSEARAYWGPRP